MPIAEVMAEYRSSKRRDVRSARFVEQHFICAAARDNREQLSQSHPGRTCAQHIDHLWTVLERKPDEPRPVLIALPLPAPLRRAGWALHEIYYWDSYFTMLGLEEAVATTWSVRCSRTSRSLIDRYGHIPNGNRTYYLSRSQPPFFRSMVELAGGARRRRSLSRVSPAAAARIRFLDGGRGHAGAAAQRIGAWCGCRTARC